MALKVIKNDFNLEAKLLSVSIEGEFIDCWGYEDEKILFGKRMDYAAEKEVFIRLLKKYLEKGIKSFELSEEQIVGERMDNTRFILVDKEHKLEKMFHYIEKKYYQDRANLFRTCTDGITEICLLSNYNFYKNWFEFLSKRSTFCTSISSEINEQDNNFLHWIFDFFIDSKQKLTLTENFYFNQKDEAISLKTYFLSQGGIVFKFNEDLYPFVVEDWLKRYEECSENKVIYLLNGRKNMARDSQLSRKRYPVLQGGRK